ncbi:helix-turn-helix domain-containing protein [Phnomibacter ginsenosidimutans]|uniref:Helix-turn-helix domain-containing protein n=2 Tax=Phnomibacter TaxID=2836216 RepID=A0A6I6G4B0_9BACT|nr:helix-turn-helix transcriptional regulator [Phnomibacter ginsenosidimutans]QGW26734.1 helix-turn-helix domain-containing protein [Phnomibacter ginsenosidimutans]
MFGQILSQMAYSKKKIATVGEQLRSEREVAKLSLREVGMHTGIDTSLLGKIERNERHPTKEQIKQLAAFFKINEKELIKELISDQLAFKILSEDIDIDTFRVAEDKVEYLKSNYDGKKN